jgi:putative addiction module component (TIGR02574 family)
MTQLQMQSLHNLSLKEKINVVQTLWDDIAQEQSLYEISSAHKKIIDDRLSKINLGTSSFKSWDEVEKKYKNLK